MKKLLIVMVVVALVMVFASTAFAVGPGGMPEAHDVDGRTFGGAVSGLAQDDPLFLADHVQGLRP